MTSPRGSVLCTYLFHGEKRTVFREPEAHTFLARASTARVTDFQQVSRPA